MRALREKRQNAYQQAGVPIPAILRKMLEIMRDKGGTQENKDQENK